MSKHKEQTFFLRIAARANLKDSAVHKVVGKNSQVMFEALRDFEVFQSLLVSGNKDQLLMRLTNAVRQPALKRLGLKFSIAKLRNNAFLITRIE